MYARLVLFNTGPGMQSKVQQVVDEMIPKARERHGFKSLQFIGNQRVNEYGFYILWDTEKDAEEAKDALLPVLKGKLTGISQGSFSPKLFEVFESI